MEAARKQEMQLCRCKRRGADERSELGACYQGVPQNDLGMRTDVLDGCPKSEGMLMLIRSMAPAVVAVDEIGGKRRYQSSRICKKLRLRPGSNGSWKFPGRVKRKSRFSGTFRGKNF